MRGGRMEAASATRCLENAEHVLTRVARFGRRERIHLFSAISAIEPRRFRRRIDPRCRRACRDRQ